jgi:hypothetical protein
VTTHRFTAADWLAAIDVQVGAAPPAAEQTIDVAPTPARRLRNWHKFVLCYAPILAGLALLMYGHALQDGANIPTALFVAGLAVAVGLSAGLAVLVRAWRTNRL